MEDSALTPTLREVIRAADDTELVFTSDIVRGWPAGALGLFDHLGIIGRDTNAKGLVCDECEERCWVVPDRRRRPSGEMVLVHMCEKRDDIGYVYYPFDCLYTWRVSPGDIARELSQVLGTTGEIREIAPGRLWSLGGIQAGKRTRRFYMGRGFCFDDAERLAGIADEHLDSDSYLFVLDRRPDKRIWPNPDGHIICLTEIAAIQDGEIILDNTELSRLLRKQESTVVPFPKPPDASWEHVFIRVLPPDHGEESSTRVELQLGRRRETRDFVEMGMNDRRKQLPEPNSAWYLLLALARNGGQLAWKKYGASDNARAHVKLLRHALRDIFQIPGDPFKDYKAGEGWTVRFALVDQREAP